MPSSTFSRCLGSRWASPPYSVNARERGGSLELEQQRLLAPSAPNNWQTFLLTCHCISTKFSVWGSTSGFSSFLCSVFYLPKIPGIQTPKLMETPRSDRPQQQHGDRSQVNCFHAAPCAASQVLTLLGAGVRGAELRLLSFEISDFNRSPSEASLLVLAVC